MHPNPHFRRRLLESYINPVGLKIVEIGALATPTLPPHEFDIKFIDYTTRDALIIEHANNKKMRIESIVHVDYPIQTHNYSEYISDRFDLAIANHVIEHIPDIVRWFQGLYNLLNKGGLLFLSIPDKRYTFDYLKRESNFVDIYRAYHEKQMKPSAAQLLENAYLSRPITAAECWSRSIPAAKLQPRTSLRKAREFAENACKNYISTHCHTFTYSSFIELFSQLQEMGLVSFNIVEKRDVDSGANEFHVLFEKQ